MKADLDFYLKRAQVKNLDFLDLSEKPHQLKDLNLSFYPHGHVSKFILIHIKTRRKAAEKEKERKKRKRKREREKEKNGR